MEQISEIDAQCEWLKDRVMVGAGYIPDYMIGGVIRYLIDGIEPGSFMKAVLSNNLKQAVGQADDENQRHLVGWVQFIHNYLPMASQGSPEKYAAWISSGGYRKQLERDEA